MTTFDEFLTALDARVTGSAGQYSAHCPVPGHGKGLGDRNKSFSIALGEDVPVVFKCHGGCDQDIVLDTLTHLGIWPVETDQSIARQARIDQLAATLELPPALIAFETWLISGRDREVDHYLDARGLDLAALKDILLHPNAFHKATGTYRPCMVAAVRDADNNLRGILRTFLSWDSPPRKIKPCMCYPGGQYAGNSIHLAPAAPEMLLAEGIETTASAMKIFDLPGWAAGGCGFLSSVRLPDLVRKITIAADNDPAGLAGAIAAAQRFKREGRQVRIVKPGTCEDFNDLLLLHRGSSEPVGFEAAEGRR